MRPVESSSDDESGFTHQQFNDNNELIDDDLEVPVMIEDEDPGFGVPIMNVAEEPADFEVEERDEDFDYSEVTPAKDEDESLFEGLEDPNYMRESFKQMAKNFNAGIEDEENVSDDDLTPEITTDVPSLS
mmetsp:Transcript_26554/g.40551  ORF Transcript_26554/g.40551 Transcript_26554/m.40551 type:complete len:130 (+) Transcript_26554:70-459(+)